MTQPVADVDFFSVVGSPEFREDPYEFFDGLRQLAPVHRTEFGVYLLTRHADAAAVVRDPKLSNDERNSDLYRTLQEANPVPPEQTLDMDRVVMLFMDPPDHTRLRGLVSKGVHTPDGGAAARRASRTSSTPASTRWPQR